MLPAPVALTRTHTQAPLISVLSVPSSSIIVPWSQAPCGPGRRLEFLLYPTYTLPSASLTLAPHCSSSLISWTLPADFVYSIPARTKKTIACSSAPFALYHSQVQQRPAFESNRDRCDPAGNNLKCRQPRADRRCSIAPRCSKLAIFCAVGFETAGLLRLPVFLVSSCFLLATALPYRRPSVSTNVRRRAEWLRIAPWPETWVGPLDVPNRVQRLDPVFRFHCRLRPDSLSR